MRKTLLFVVCLLISSHSFAQPSFVFDSTAFCGFVSIDASDWGDYDNDGDLDFLVLGLNASSIPSKQIFKNDGFGNFTKVDIALPSIVSGAVDWGDYDNDGDMDILLVGSYFGTYYGRIYRNDGGDVFNLAVMGIKGVDYSACAWGDYDNDGDLDFVISGKDNSKVQTLIYRNDAGAFTNINVELFGTQWGRVEWADFDNDNDLDLIVAGNDYYYAFNTKVYKNMGNDVFKDMDVSFEQSYPHFFDYNSNGKLDILCGYKIYKNTGDTSFVDIGATIPMELSQFSSYADYDNDGDLDILNINFGHYRFFQYNGGTTYANQGDITTDCRGGSSYWIDYNNDRKPDYFVKYQDNSYKTHYRLFKNTTATANAAPTVPTGLSVTTKGSTATIHWTKSTDALTPQNGIHYNVRIGTTKTGIDVLNPYANLSNGYRKLFAFGNCATNDSFVFKGLEPGKYYYNVQSIDNNFNPSAFSPLDSFIVPEFDNALTLGFKQLYQGHISWGDYDSDGDMDALINGTDNGLTAVTLLYRNDGNSKFTELNAGLKGVYEGYTEWGDYDNDGDLDIALFGNTKFTYPNFQPVSMVYRNDGNDVFTDINLPMTGVHGDGNLTWGDYDNDGKLDLLLCGYLRLIAYHNDGNDKFSEKIIAQYSNYYSASWVDIDNDNDLDIVVDSTFDFNTTFLKVYINDGKGNFIFTAPSIPVARYFQSSLDWSDYDNDGDLDLGLCGDNTTKVYRNNGGILVLHFNATDSINGQMKWGDYDNDGDPDILVSGAYNAVNKTFFYQNNSGVFVKISSVFDNVLGNMAWVDIDNDNDLDVSLITANNDFDKYTKFYLNNSKPNTRPDAPTNCKHSFPLGTDKVVFSWDKSIDAEQSGSNADGLTYNIWVKSIDENKTILDPMSDLSSGWRKIAVSGNAGTDNSYFLKGLAQGKYVWKVQSIDHAKMGSPFSVADTFMIGLFADTPSDITLCAGDTITVPLRLDGLEVETDNAFIAQLSDPYGYFDVPTQIAAVAGTQSGSIQVVIPASALAGIKYKIRFLSTSPRYIGIPNMPYITINTSPQPMITGKPIVCQKDIGMGYQTYNVQGNAYTWTITNGSVSSGQNTAQVLIKWGTATTGKVQVIESNAKGCVSVSTMNIIINPLPIVKLGKDTTFCKGNTLVKDAGAYYSYNWNNGMQTRTISITESGSYSVQVTDDNGCKANSDTLEVNILTPYKEQICMITADSITGKNKIIWERTNGMRTKSYNIYKISGTKYKKIGSLPFSSLAVFNDSTSTPEMRVDRYAITTVDSCDNESEKSYYHQTMLLQAAKGTTPNEAVLNWNKYIDESGNWEQEYYYIYKGKTKDAITLLDSVSGLLEPRYNDPTFDGVSAYYQIVIRREQLCSPAVLKAEAGPYAQSLSNIAEYKTSGLENQNSLPVSVYPNPFTNEINISYNLEESGDVLIEIINETGQKVLYEVLSNKISGQNTSIIDTEVLNVGVYFLKIIAGNRQNITKVTKF